MPAPRQPRKPLPPGELTFGSLPQGCPRHEAPPRRRRASCARPCSCALTLEILEPRAYPNDWLGLLYGSFFGVGLLALGRPWPGREPHGLGTGVDSLRPRDGASDIRVVDHTLVLPPTGAQVVSARTERARPGTITAAAPPATNPGDRRDTNALWDLFADDPLHAPFAPPPGGAARPDVRTPDRDSGGGGGSAAAPAILGAGGGEGTGSSSPPSQGPAAAVPAAAPPAAAAPPSAPTGGPGDSGNPPPGRTVTTAHSEQLLAEYGRRPLAFEVNQGQTDARVRYLSRGPGYTLFLTKDSAVVTLAQPGQSGTHAHDVIRLAFAGANPHAKVSGVAELTAQSN
jgi:hypothetical protein